MKTVLKATPALALTILAATGCQTTQMNAAERTENVPQAVAVGAPVSCIQTTQIDQSHVRNDYVIDFELRNGRVYRNELPNRCPNLG